jgi:hypothetical protein
MYFVLFDIRADHHCWWGARRWHMVQFYKLARVLTIIYLLLCCNPDKNCFANDIRINSRVVQPTPNIAKLSPVVNHGQPSTPGTCTIDKALLFPLAPLSANYVNGCPTSLFTVTAQIGYCRFGFDFAARPPGLSVFPDTPFSFLFPTGINMVLINPMLPVGFIQAKAESISGAFIELGFKANVPRDVRVNTPDAPLADLTDFQLRTAMNMVGPRTWDGGEFQWWALDADLGYRYTPALSFMAGIRRDSQSVSLVNPRSSSGQLFNFNVTVPNIINLNRMISVNFSSKLWIPYLGVAYNGPNYRGSLIWGPSAWTEMSIPYRDVLSLSGTSQSGVPPFQLRLDYNYECQTLKAANLIEYKFEYDFDSPGRFGIQFWTIGNWMQLTWDGSFHQATTVKFQLPGLPTQEITSPFWNDADPITFSKWMIAAGIGTVYSF